MMEIAHTIAGWSEDPNKGVGAVIMDTKSHTIVSTGYNGLPRGLSKDVKYRLQKPEKYLYIEHAERNAIYNAARLGVGLQYCVIFVTLFPCNECCKAIIQSGIKKVVTYTPDFSDDKYGELFKVSLEMFTECGIKIEYLDE